MRLTVRRLAALVLLTFAAGAPAAELRFEVTAAPGLIPQPVNGRVFVVMARPARGSFRRGAEPRFSIGDTGLDTPPVLGCDADAFTGAKPVTLDGSCPIFPIESLAKLPAGDYDVQAVLHTNRDLNLPNAPGDYFGPPRKVTLDPVAGGTVKLELTQQNPPEQLPPDTARVKFIKLPSKLLSQFYGRPMFLRAGLRLPADFDQNPQKRYPLRVHVGGYGTRFTSIVRAGNGAGPDGPQFLTLLTDGAGPLGDPYQVDSANHGPYGAALTQELIPYVEATYRGIGRPYARFTDGHSTGGWVSLALQVFYPDFFNGCWSFAPDPVDFRAYELIDVYKDVNAYVNRFGFERPAKRLTNGETVYTVRHECQIENVLGRGDRWTLSGKDWCAWNATFGPRGPDGLPAPLWDGKTGVIDRSVTEHWKRYDLRRVLQDNWPTLGPKLRGKMHIWVGDGDDYFLNNAVHLLDAALQRLDPPYEGTITYGPGQGHGFHPLSEAATVQAMAAAMERAKPRE
jgi:S-formylglutathione hydrolase FrmB